MGFRHSSSYTGGGRPARGQMKCYQCRKAYLSKDGKWFNWNNIQVFLCKQCDLDTRERPERHGMK